MPEQYGAVVLATIRHLKRASIFGEHIDDAAIADRVLRILGKKKGDYLDGAGEEVAFAFNEYLRESSVPDFKDVP